MDKITYTKLEDGTVLKTIEQIIPVEQMQSEKDALQKQIEDMQAGTTDDPNAQVLVDETVANYQEAINILTPEE